MALGTPEQCLAQLRVLYRDAFKIDKFDDNSVLLWASRPELWAEHQIRYRGWGYHATEAVVRNCRMLRRRAEIAAYANASAPAGADAFDPLMPESCTLTEEASSDAH